MRFFERTRGRKNQVRRARRQRAAHIRAAGLHDDRVPLRRPSDIQRSGDFEMPALVVELMHLVSIEVAATGTIAQHRIVLPAIPQRLDHIDEFFGACVTIVVRRHFVEPEIARLTAASRGNDIPPARPPEI